MITISESTTNGNTGLASTVIIRAKDMCPGLLVITELVAMVIPHNALNGDPTSQAICQSFLPDGYIDHDEDGKPFIRSRCAIRKKEVEVNIQHVARDTGTNTSEIQEDSWEHFGMPKAPSDIPMLKAYVGELTVTGLNKVSSGTPMPKVKPAAIDADTAYNDIRRNRKQVEINQSYD